MRRGVKVENFKEGLGTERIFQPKDLKKLHIYIGLHGPFSYKLFSTIFLTACNVQ